MTDRPNCLKRDACQAKTSKHCRSCTAKAVAARPGEAEKRGAATRRRFEDPHFRARHSRAVKRSFDKVRDDPEWQESKREGARHLREVLARPEMRARVYSPEVNARRGAACQEYWLGWCPPEYRAHYRRLVSSFKYSAERAKEMILELIRADERKLRRGIIPEALRS